MLDHHLVIERVDRRVRGGPEREEAVNGPLAKDDVGILFSEHAGKQGYDVAAELREQLRRSRAAGIALVVKGGNQDRDGPPAVWPQRLDSVGKIRVAQLRI